MRTHRLRWLGILLLIGTALWLSPWPTRTGWGQENSPAGESGSSGDEASQDQEIAPSQSDQEESTPQDENTPSAPDEDTSMSQPEEPESTSPEESTPPAEEMEPAEGSPSATESMTVPEPEAGKEAQKYTVKKGDTLWDISNAYMKDSFLWPKLWKYNQYIINPDLIYPGNTIDLPSEEALKKAAEAAAKTEKPTPIPPPKVVEPAPLVEAEKPIEAEKPVEVEAKEEVPPPAAPINKGLLESSGFIISGEKAAGTVIGARDGRQLIGEMETAYLLPRSGNQPQVGDRYTIYRVTRKVYHPVTGKYMGVLIRILGVAEVTGANPHEKAVTATILNSFDTIYQGDLLLPHEAMDVSDGIASPASPSSPVQGFIVDVYANRAAHAQHDVVYLDRGRQDGVHSGDQFNIIREGEKTSIFSPGGGVRLPQRTIGQLKVISVQDATSTAQITESTEVVYRGDRYESPEQP